MFGFRERCFCNVVWFSFCVFRYSACNEFCRVRSSEWNANEKLKFTLMFDIRENFQDECGAISSESLQQYVAVKYALEILNSGNESYIPGVKLGFQVYDDCRSETFAARNALALVNPHLPDKITQCISNNTSSALNIGIIGPSRSSTTSVTGNLLKSSGIPIISPSATLATLSDKTQYPNILRTAASDTNQVEVIVQTLKKLDWSYAALVHTEDSYGENGMEAIKKRTKQENICITKTIKIESNTKLHDVIAELRRITHNAKDGILAVIYFGQKDRAENLLFSVNQDKNIKKLLFIMSDAVGQNVDVFQSKSDNLVQGALTISPSRTQLPDFTSYYNNNLKEVRNANMEDDLISKYLSEKTLTEDLTIAKHNDYVPLTIDAVYALITALKTAQIQNCGGQAGVCDKLKNEVIGHTFLEYVRNTRVDYTSMAANFAPAVFQQNRRSFNFNENGDVLRGNGTSTYVINSFDTSTSESKFIEVGEFRGDVLDLDKSKIIMKTPNGQDVTGSYLLKSECSTTCSECTDTSLIPMVHVKGDVYILGIFSLHSGNTDHNRFGCSGFRNVSSDTLYLEGFLHAVADARSRTGINYGAIAFDDCYNPLKIISTLTAFFSDLNIADEKFSYAIPWNKVACVIGPLSSGVTIPVAEFFSRLNIPVVSYASTSPDLDDKTNFPYFLRTVPSDDEQAEAMVAIIKEMGWEYVDVLYVANNYGTKGKDAFLRIAANRNVCTGEPFKINEISSDDVELYNIITELHKAQAKVVVFFGIDTRYSALMKALNARQDLGDFVFIVSEEWGTKNQLLEDGGKAGRGTITLNLASPQLSDRGFTNYVLQRNLNNAQNNPWFTEFWQHLFECNVKGSFNNVFSKECAENLKLSDTVLQGHLRDERIAHVRSAVYAVTSGLAKVKDSICMDYTFPCDFYYNPKYTQNVLTFIRDAEVETKSLNSYFKLFDKNGNGAIGFKIFNIRQNEEGQYYEEVGSYTNTGLTLDKDKLRFYTELGQEIENIASGCEGKRCEKCVRSTSTEDVTAKPGGLTGIDNGTFRIADTIILVLVIVIITFLIIVIIVTCYFFKRKMEGLSKQMQAIENQHVYEPVRYQNRPPSDQTRFTPGHDRIQFVNPRINSLNSINSVGVNNPGFLNDDHYLHVNGSIISNGSVHGILPPKPDVTQHQLLNQLNITPQQSQNGQTINTLSSPLAQFYGSQLYMDDPLANGTLIVNGQMPNNLNSLGNNRAFHLPIQSPHTPASPQQSPEETVQYSDVVTPPEPSENLHLSPQRHHNGTVSSPVHSDRGSQSPGTPYQPTPGTPTSQQMSPTASNHSSATSSYGHNGTPTPSRTEVDTRELLAQRAHPNFPGVCGTDADPLGFFRPRAHSNIPTVSPTDADPHGLLGQRVERMPKPPRQNLPPNLPKKVPGQLASINRTPHETVQMNDVKSPVHFRRQPIKTPSPLIGGRDIRQQPVNTISANVPDYPRQRQSSDQTVTLDSPQYSEEEHSSGSSESMNHRQGSMEARISRV
ncbi:hypothetical protein SNE40_014775 [Patella caerulea]|uniref:Receptor ligand binding region domain-containing protein n=1 Tax=Patella caerulea TaxID=87958 RepID=A0AAN8PJN3_PATCE